MKKQYIACMILCAIVSKSYASDRTSPSKDIIEDRIMINYYPVFEKYYFPNEKMPDLVPWTTTINLLKQFVTHKSKYTFGSPEESLTTALSNVENANTTLINSITTITKSEVPLNKDIKGTARYSLPEMFSKETIEEQIPIIRSVAMNMTNLQRQLAPKTFDLPGQKECQELLLRVASLLATAAIKLTRDSETFVTTVYDPAIEYMKKKEAADTQ